MIINSIGRPVILALAAVVLSAAGPWVHCGVASETVAQWDFSRDNDLNFDGLPDGWDRVYGRRYPRYLDVNIRPHDAEQEAGMRAIDTQVMRSWRSLRTRLPSLPSLPPSLADLAVDRFLHAQVDGGAILAHSPAFKVGPSYSYHLAARIRSDGLTNNKAWIELVFLAADGTLVRTESTSVIGGTTPWAQVQIGPVACPPTATTARLDLHFAPTDRPDMTGSIGIDDIRVERLPRIRIESDSPHGLYEGTADPIIRCIVSGLADEVGGLRFSLHDETGREICQEIKMLQRLSAEELAASTGSEAIALSEGYGGTAQWQLPKLGPGFYSVRIQLADRQAVEFRLKYTFAVLADLPNPQGPFGWSLLSPDRHNVPRELPEWLAQCRVQWVKYPCWVEPTAIEATDDLAWLMGRLDDQGIVPVGVLANPPESVAAKIGALPNDPIAILLRDVELWQPLLEPVMTRLTTGVRWWQLGGDNDFSFLGRSQMTQTLRDIRSGLQGFGEPINVVLNWPWVDPIPPRDEWSWQAVCLSDPVPQTAQEIDAYFEGSGKGFIESTPTASTPDAANDSSASLVTSAVASQSPGGAQSTSGEQSGGAIRETGGEPLRPWLTLNPLSRDQYTRSERIRDLILRMVAVRGQRIPAAFVSDPFDTRHAILRPDGTPDELLLPWRTAAAVLGPLRPVGSLQLPSHSQNILLVNENEAALLVWSDQATTETLYLGEQARQLDAYGRTIPIEQVEQRGGMQQRIAITPEPTFVVGIDRTAALWSLGVRLDRTRIDSLLGREQVVHVLFENPSMQTVSGSFTIDAPEAWSVSQRPRSITAEPGRPQRSPVTLELRNDATIGRENVAIHFELDGDRTRQFTVWRYLEVGLEDLRIDVTTRLLPDGRLVVRQELTSTADRTLHFDCYVYARGRIRQRRGTTLAPHATELQEFFWPEGQQLVGDLLLLRVEERDGHRALNYRFNATR